MAASIAFRLSGGASNADHAASLGGAMSSNSVTADAIFDVVSAAEALAGDTEYRCIYVYNDGDKALTNTVIWISDQANTGTLAMALGGEGLDGTAETVGNEGTAPSGESFSSPTTQGAGLNIGALGVGQRYPIWLRRSIDAATPGVALASNAAQISVAYEYIP